MKVLFTCLVLLFVSAPVLAHPEGPEGTVRIYIYEDGDNVVDSYGSGAMISSTLILTNYHVVKDRRNYDKENNRSVQVRFTDGSRSFASVLQQDENWDVALLRIWPTRLQPFVIGERPKAGETATIQGFGWDYEYIAGVGSVGEKFMAPNKSTNHNDFFSVVGVAARQGDSGGPITDRDGKLIGILFGSNNQKDDKYTQGVTIDRIQQVFGSKFKLSREVVPPNDPYDLSPTNPYRIKKQL